MSQQLFVDREEELRFLTERYLTPGPECLVLYGRRRVGKTALLARFLEDAGGIYFLASEEGDEGNIREFSHYAAQYLDDPHFGDVKYPDWQAVFSALVRHRSFPPDSGGKPVLVIDEFPYLISRNRAIPSIFQKIWDTVLSRESLMLVLCGSSVAAMETEVLGYKSPLYGRRTGQWQVEPLQYPYLSEFLPYEGEDLAMSWFILGGVPAYLKIFSPDRTLWENVAEQILRKGAYLYSEPELLLQYEFREAGNYMAILRAMADGRTTLGSLCQETGLDRGMVSKYLSVLTRLRIVTDEVPVTAHSGYRRRHYRLSDPYLSFWFRFVYPGRAEIETGHCQAVRRASGNSSLSIAGKCSRSSAGNSSVQGSSFLESHSPVSGDGGRGRRRSILSGWMSPRGEHCLSNASGRRLHQRRQGGSCRTCRESPGLSDGGKMTGTNDSVLSPGISTGKKSWVMQGPASSISRISPGSQRCGDKTVKKSRSTLHQAYSPFLYFSIDWSIPGSDISPSDRITPDIYQ
ncbi:MAG TPA: ATP-binding protein [Methanoregulaceae archaeon]|nr:ATP-binding protein [Methanoregulaceae archaeon]